MLYPVRLFNRRKKGDVLIRTRKKAWLILLIILGVLLLGAAILAITQWDNIKAVTMGLKYSEEEISQMQTDSKKHFEEATGIDLSKVEEMSKYVNPDGTPIETPEGSQAQLPQEPVSGQKPQEQQSPAPAQPQKPASSEVKPSTQKKPSKDTSEVEAVMARFYALQSNFVGQLESLKNSTIAAYKAIPVGQRTIQKRAAMGRDAISQATALEGQCDAQMTALLGELSAALKRAGMSQDLVSDVKYYYASEKGYMKASYMSQFSKYLS